MSAAPTAPPSPRTRGVTAVFAFLTLVASVALLGCSRVNAENVQVIGPGGALSPVTPLRASGPPPVLPVASAPPPKQVVEAAPPKIGAQSANVVDDASGAVLFEFDARRPLPPASLTKIATAALAIDRGRLDEMVTADIDYDDEALYDVAVMGLKRGDRFRLRDLLYGMMLPSGGDAALTVGRAVSGSDAAFVKELNAFMVSIGLHDTHFIDPYGLGGPTHVSTAYDIAMVSRYAMRQSLFAKIVGERQWNAEGSRTIHLWNSNEWMYGYPGADGVKTGFTEEAGATLSASATRSGHRVFVVILNSNSRDQDTTALMDWAFRTFCWGDGQLGCTPNAAGATPLSSTR